MNDIFDERDIFDDEEFLAPNPAVCVGCGCSEFNPCEGGCIWATDGSLHPLRARRPWISPMTFMTLSSGGSELGPAA